MVLVAVIRTLPLLFSKVAQKHPLHPPVKANASSYFETERRTSFYAGFEQNLNLQPVITKKGLPHTVAATVLSIKQYPNTIDYIIISSTLKIVSSIPFCFWYPNWLFSFSILCIVSLSVSLWTGLSYRRDFHEVDISLWYCCTIINSQFKQFMVQLSCNLKSE